jgi:hypothetical protein
LDLPAGPFEDHHTAHLVSFVARSETFDSWPADRDATDDDDGAGEAEQVGRSF